MSNSNSSAVLVKGVKDLQVIETGLLLVVSVLLQFVIHLIPPVNNMPLGLILLPAFYAPLFALIFFRFHVALSIAILTPALNYLITKAPSPEILSSLTIETVVFVIAAYFMLRNQKMQLISALAAIFIAKIFSMAFIPVLGYFTVTGEMLVRTFIVSIPGIIILSVLNILFLRYKNN